MILVTVGTTAFDSLIEYIDKNHVSDEEIVLQIADGQYLPKTRKYFRYLENYDNCVNEASVVVCHGGAGTLFKMLHRGKKIIAMNNSDRKDQHQIDLISELAREKYLIWCQNMTSLAAEIKSIQHEQLVAYKSQPCGIVEEIENFLMQKHVPTK